MTLCGYCKLHRRKISYREFQSKKCGNPKKQIKKTVCQHFHKIEDHPIWGQLRRKKEKRILYKKLKKEQA